MNEHDWHSIKYDFKARFGIEQLAFHRTDAKICLQLTILFHRNMIAETEEQKKLRLKIIKLKLS
jgi:hypothetical protein